MVRVEKPAISPADLRCQAEPKAANPDDGQAAAGLYILELVAWGRDCEAKLGVARAAIEP